MFGLTRSVLFKEMDATAWLLKIDESGCKFPPGTILFESACDLVMRAEVGCANFWGPREDSPKFGVTVR